MISKEYAHDIISTVTVDVIYSLMGFLSLFTVILVFALLLGYFKKYTNTQTYQYIPSIFTTLGVLGTFLGIYNGLQEFDVNDITTSIPSLLSGLKDAFSTSLIGIILSLLSGVALQICSDINKEEQENIKSEIDALNEIIHILKNT